MPFPRKISAAQIVGLCLIAIGIVLCIALKDPTTRFADYVCFGIGAVFVFNEPLTNSTFTWNMYGLAINLTGSVVLFVVLALWDPIGRYVAKFHSLRSITVIVHGREGTTDRIMAGKGNVIMYVNGEPSSNPIDDRGTAKFSNLRVGDNYRLAVSSSEPFRIRKDSLYEVDDQSEVYLEVYLKGIDKVFGFVKYRGNAVPGAQVSIGMMDTLTDFAGRFLFRIPDSLQRPSYQVNVNKAGYKPKMVTAHPESDQPTFIFLEKL